MPSERVTDQMANLALGPDRKPRKTNFLRNVDMPGLTYNHDGAVSLQDFLSFLVTKHFQDPVSAPLFFFFFLVVVTDEFEKDSISAQNVPRPGFNTTGKEIELNVNALPIVKFPNKVRCR